MCSCHSGDHIALDHIQTDIYQQATLRNYNRNTALESSEIDYMGWGGDGSFKLDPSLFLGIAIIFNAHLPMKSNESVNGQEESCFQNNTVTL